MKFTSICTILDPLINPSCKYGGGIPGDNRHWSNSLVGHPWKASGVQREPTAASPHQHLAPEIWLRQPL